MKKKPKLKPDVTVEVTGGVAYVKVLKKGIVVKLTDYDDQRSSFVGDKAILQNISVYHSYKGAFAERVEK